MLLYWIIMFLSTCFSQEKASKKKRKSITYFRDVGKYIMWIKNLSSSETNEFVSYFYEIKWRKEAKTFPHGKIKMVLKTLLIQLFVREFINKMLSSINIYEKQNFLHHSLYTLFISFLHLKSRNFDLCHY